MKYFDVLGSLDSLTQNCLIILSITHFLIDFPESLYYIYIGVAT